MTHYSEDKRLPSHGRRAYVDNLGTVRVRINNYPGYTLISSPDSWEMYLNVNIAEKTYHATVEVIVKAPSRRHYVSVEVSSEVIDEVVKLSMDKEFMSLKNDDIFPDIYILDGRSIQIKVNSDEGNVLMDNGCLEDTLLDGKLPTSKKVFNTPFHRLAAIAWNTLGIDPQLDNVGPK